jgi:hypothetical protein
MRVKPRRNLALKAQCSTARGASPGNWVEIKPALEGRRRRSASPLAGLSETRGPPPRVSSPAAACASPWASLFRAFSAGHWSRIEIGLWGTRVKPRRNLALKAQCSTARGASPGNWVEIKPALEGWRRRSASPLAGLSETRGPPPGFGRPLPRAPHPGLRCFALSALGIGVELK